MIKLLRTAAAACGAALLLCMPASAQVNSALQGPPWAQPLTATDVIPTTGGRTFLATDGIVASVRVTIAPNRGGVARVIRYDDRGASASVSLRRFTGHPSTGWWLWGSDAPLTTTPSAAQRSELARLARAARGPATLSATPSPCPNGEQVFVELAVEGEVTTSTSPCVDGSTGIGRLALRLSEIAGSRTEEELAAAAASELMAADRAFAAMARVEGVPAAFTRYAADDALIITSSEIVSGRAGVTQSYADWPAGARLEWSPETGRVSARGDMGWTWGNSVYIAPDGTRRPGRYVSVWTRDHEGNWRYAFDAPIR
jgi:ketosteroid isomerase-like protein